MDVNENLLKQVNFFRELSAMYISPSEKKTIRIKKKIENQKKWKFFRVLSAMYIFLHQKKKTI